MNQACRTEMYAICKKKKKNQPESTTQIWVVTRDQYGISALVPQTSFRGETTSGVAKCRLFSQVSFKASS